MKFIKVSRIIVGIDIFINANTNRRGGRAEGQRAAGVPTREVFAEDVLSWRRGLQLSVIVFLRIVVSPLGLFGQLPAVLGLVFLVPSGLGVRRPEWLLGVGA